MDASSLSGRILTTNSILFFLFLIILSLIFRRKINQNLNLETFPYFLVSVSFSIIIATTIRYWMKIGTQAFWFTDINNWKLVYKIDANWILNFLLFIPAAFFSTYYIKKNKEVTSLLILMSFTIETIQGLTQWGASDPADWVANSTGVFVGLALAILTSYNKKRKKIVN